MSSGLVAGCLVQPLFLLEGSGGSFAGEPLLFAYTFLTLYLEEVAPTPHTSTLSSKQVGGSHTWIIYGEKAGENQSMIKDFLLPSHGLSIVPLRGKRRHSIPATTTRLPFSCSSCLNFKPSLALSSILGDWTRDFASLSIAPPSLILSNVHVHSNLSLQLFIPSSIYPPTPPSLFQKQLPQRTSSVRYQPQQNAPLTQVGLNSPTVPHCCFSLCVFPHYARCDCWRRVEST